MSLLGKNSLKFAFHCLFMTVILIFTQGANGYGQQRSDRLVENKREANIKNRLADTTLRNYSILLDSLVLKDTVAKDSEATKTLSDSLGIRISPDALSDV